MFKLMLWVLEEGGSLEGKCPSFTTINKKYLHNIIGDINLHLSVKVVQDPTKALWKNGVYTIYTNGGLIICCEVQRKVTINKRCSLNFSRRCG